METTDGRSVSIQMPRLWFWITLAVFILAFAGEPDLMDAVISRISQHHEEVSE